MIFFEFPWRMRGAPSHWRHNGCRELTIQTEIEWNSPVHYISLYIVLYICVFIIIIIRRVTITFILGAFKHIVHMHNSYIILFIFHILPATSSANWSYLIFNLCVILLLGIDCVMLCQRRLNDNIAAVRDGIGYVRDDSGLYMRTSVAISGCIPARARECGYGRSIIYYRSMQSKRLLYNASHEIFAGKPFRFSEPKTSKRISVISMADGLLVAKPRFLECSVFVSMNMKWSLFMPCFWPVQCVGNGLDGIVRFYPFSAPGIQHKHTYIGHTVLLCTEEIFNTLTKWGISHEYSNDRILCALFDETIAKWMMQNCRIEIEGIRHYICGAILFFYCMESFCDSRDLFFILVMELDIGYWARQTEHDDDGSWLFIPNYVNYASSHSGYPHINFSLMPTDSNIADDKTRDQHQYSWKRNIVLLMMILGAHTHKMIHLFGQYGTFPHVSTFHNPEKSHVAFVCVIKQIQIQIHIETHHFPVILSFSTVLVNKIKLPVCSPTPGGACTVRLSRSQWFLMKLKAHHNWLSKHSSHLVF